MKFIHANNKKLIINLVLRKRYWFSENR